MALPNQDTSRPLRGYNLLANLMAQHSDFAIHRRFMAAHHFDLMLQQAEIVHQLHDLGEIKLLDMNSTDDMSCRFDINFDDLIQSSKVAGKSLQYQKLLELRSSLKAHGKYIDPVRSLSMLPDARKEDLKTSRQFLSSQSKLNGFPLHLFERDIWSEQSQDDLTSLVSRVEGQDMLSEFVGGKLLSWCYKTFLHKFKPNALLIYDPFLDAQAVTPLDHFSDRAHKQAVALLSTLLSSLFPTLSIFVLYFVGTQLVRLGLILVFTMCFSVILMTVTNAKRSECFAAAAAFSAIQVVFVSGTSSSSSPVSATT